MSGWEILLPAFALCVLLVLTHAYFGLHVLARGIIFVDIALAQAALLGSAVAFWIGYDGHTPAAHAFAFGAALLAALGFAALRWVPDKITREVTIGTVYVVATAASVVILSRSAAGMEELKAMLNGNILWTQWRDVATIGAVAAALAALHLLFSRRFYALSFGGGSGRGQFLWELLFFASFATIITFALDQAGVLLVFAYLIVPAFSASLLVADFARAYALAVALALAATVAGLWLSFSADLPTGATMVVVLGLLPALAAALRLLRRRRLSLLCRTKNG